MKSNSFFPNQLKIIAWIVFIPSVLIGLITLFANSEIAEPTFLDAKVYGFAPENFLSEKPVFKQLKNNLLNEILGVLIIMSGLILGFSKVKGEDEFIAQIRSKSLIWATYINYGILLLAIILVYDLSFFTVMVFSTFMSLVLFVLHFHWQLYKLNNKVIDEE
jgi:hypothetical protein